MQIGSLIMILLSGAVTLRRDKSILYNRTSIYILFILFIINTINSSIQIIKSGIGLYGGLFHVNSLSFLFNNTIYGISCIILLITSFYSLKAPRIFKLISNRSNVNINKKNTQTIKDNKEKEIQPLNDITPAEFSAVEEEIERTDTFSKSEKKSDKFKILEYPLVLQFVITGGIFLIASSDIVSIFLSIELQSYGLYLLAAMYRNSEYSVGAGLTYFLLGGMSSCFILLGTALLYTNSGVTNLEGFYIINNIWDITKYDNISIYQNNYVSYSLIIITVGFLFKVSAAPFHFWSPDVYDAIPTVVTTFVAIIAKLSILVFLFEIVHYTTNWGFTSVDWRNILLLSSLLSLIIGSVLGLNQFRIKRLYAYSTISHLGFILLALSINTVESIQGFIFYLIQYSISNLNAFILLISIGYVLYTYKNDKLQGELLLDKNNSPIQLISQIKGFFYINPLLTLSLVITIYSFVGIPPLLGFFGKQMVLSAAMDKGLVFISLVAILSSVISAVYYLNLIKNMFFDKADYYMSSLKIDNFTKIKTKYKSTDKTNNSYEYLNNLTIGYGKYKIELFSAFSVIASIITLLIVEFLLLQQDLLNITNNVSIYVLNI